MTISEVFPIFAFKKQLLHLSHLAFLWSIQTVNEKEVILTLDKCHDNSQKCAHNRRTIYKASYKCTYLINDVVVIVLSNTGSTTDYWCFMGAIMSQKHYSVMYANFTVSEIGCSWYNLPLYQR